MDRTLRVPAGPSAALLTGDRSNATGVQKRERSGQRLLSDPPLATAMQPNNYANRGVTRVSTVLDLTGGVSNEMNGEFDPVLAFEHPGQVLARAPSRFRPGVL